MRLSLFSLAICFASLSYAQSITSVLNAATYTSAVAPGTWVAIFGTQLAPGAMAASSVPFPTQLNNVSVTVAGVAAPLNYVSATQINALIPFEAATLAGVAQIKAAVVVTTPAGASPAFSITLQRNAPSIYTKDSSGSGDALAFDGNFKVVTALGTAPIVLYATGLGPTNPPVATGALGASAEPLNRVQDSVSVTIGGSPATVLYAGLAPGLHAVYQLNVQPPATSLGNSLTISAGNYAGKSLTLPVVAGTNVANVSATMNGVYPTGSLGFSAVLFAGKFTAGFDIAPGAKPFQIVAQANGVTYATISIDPTQNTWQATYTVPNSQARSYNFLSAGVTVYDYIGGVPFPGNIVPLSRTDPAALAAINNLPLPNSAGGTGASGTFTSSGTFSGSHFTISDTVNAALENFGSFQFFPLAITHGATSALFTLYVDNMLAASKVVNYTI